MFNDKKFVKLWNTPGMTLPKIRPFLSDKRLLQPQGVMGQEDMTRQFAGNEQYPYELSIVAYCNGM